MSEEGSPPADDAVSTLGRTRALVALGVRRVLGQFTRASSRRVLLSACGVAIAVALMTTVTGVSLGLASQSAIQSEDVDYWIVPDSPSASSVAVSVGGPKLGSVHAVTDRLASNERIDYVTPVHMRILRVQNATGHQEYVLAIGVIPPETPRTVVGLSTRGLTPGDPHYANGTYEGPWTGQTIASEAAATLLGTEAGGTLSIASENTNRSLTVVRTQEANMDSGVGPVPVLLVHLSELQDVSGAASGDQADQILVSTNAPGVKTQIEQIYPRTDVVTRTGLSRTRLTSSNLPLAVAIAALVASLVIGTLFVATMMGLEMTADRRNLAVLGAIGYSTRSRTILVVVQTVTVALLGGVGGVVLGAGAIAATNALAAHYVGVAPIALFDPLLIGYGIGVAGLIGLLAAPYPVWLSKRTELVEVLS